MCHKKPSKAGAACMPEQLLFYYEKMVKNMKLPFQSQHIEFSSQVHFFSPLFQTL